MLDISMILLIRLFVLCMIGILIKFSDIKLPLGQGKACFVKIIIYLKSVIFAQGPNLND